MCANDTVIGVSILISDNQLSQQLNEAVKRTPGFELVDDPLEAQNALMLIEVSGEPETTLKEVFGMKQQGYSGGILMTASNYHQDLLLRCIQMGVDEFLPSPLAPDDFIASLRRYREKFLATQEGLSAGTSIAILGARGGVGTTTIAVGMATYFAEKGRKVVLLDLSRPYGDVSLFLDFEHDYSWVDAMTNQSRIDSTFLKSILYKYSDNLYVLPAPAQHHDRLTLSSDSIQDLLFAATSSFDMVIVDAGSVQDNAALTILERVDSPLMITQMGLACLSSAKYVVELCKQVSPMLGEMIKLIVNRYTSRVIIEKNEIEQITHKDIFAEIAEDNEKPLSAINRGIPLLEAYPHSPSAKGIRAVAQKITKSEPRAKKSRFFSRI
ncbi:AAA family ATPase [Halodesulfovibrio marinisediminis]|uniref:CobQ/CobB/MinD/ParA nucleotide binding domain-containing protein n=1 Tax=Halodesulfovibrio marinisediminis DSM 17456 TaxID=1121457 RepID=A0A1N6EA64_9BACT|nr:AAA family ATPase [Halodesulfovibrio marinisediminis]SIN79922.1 CobQ/CobB/MinD/ParA nucleotide binding domain-containing protein [Halodesulfovibrio marinisediminis DSM 17456]